MGETADSVVVSICRNSIVIEKIMWRSYARDTGRIERLSPSFHATESQQRDM